MTHRTHATGPKGPLCARNLSLHRLPAGPGGEARGYDIGTDTMSPAKAGELPTCRHCLRVLGLIPKVTRAKAEGVEDEIGEADETEGEE